MDRAELTAELHRQIIADLQRFRLTHPQEAPYAYGLIGGQPGSPYLGSAIATQEALQRVAARYRELGYRYSGFREERPASASELADWLRWANPDDGWHYSDFPDHRQLHQMLLAFIDAGGFGEDAEGFEEFCVDVLGSLEHDPDWQREMNRHRLVVGFTYGSDPRDFLRTATRANPYQLVQQLWRETWRADELEPRIQAPSSRPV